MSQNGDEDQEQAYQPIRDEWAYEFTVSKANERKIIQHIDFEGICSKYWSLLLHQDSVDRSKNVINQKQYSELMKRILKVLLPLYREVEMAKEISQEWLMVSNGQAEMDLLLFQKSLFRVAHSWATHIDIREYVELLEKVYERIICKKVIRGADGFEEIFLPQIQVEIRQQESARDEEDDEWTLCEEDEEDDLENFDYDWKEDDQAVPRKVKRRKGFEGQDEREQGLMNSRDPIEYSETVQYFPNEDDPKKPGPLDIETDVYAEMQNIYPLGYPTEQYITKLKNDVHESFIQLKEEKRRALEEMKRQLFEGNTNSMQVDRTKDSGIEKDPGLIEESGFYFEEEFTMHDHVNGVRIKTICHIRDAIYNQLRLVLKNDSNLHIRSFFEFPNKAVREGKQTIKVIGINEHQTEINSFGYNPALERRISLKMITCEFGTYQKTKYINVNYLIVDPVYDTAYRSDVRRVETSDKMSIKPLEGEFQKDEEFNHVTASYREVMNILHAKKFETFYSDKLQNKNAQYAERAKKIYEAEQMRKQNARYPEHLTAKGIDEINHELKTEDLRQKHGPFYQLVSKEGILEDDFVNCGMMDLIEYANRETMKILIIGKPRSGKSTLASQLSQTLDLEKISVDIWINDKTGFLFRIKDRIDNPPEIEPQFTTRINAETGEEEQVELPPPEWRTPLEVSVQNALTSGNELNHEDINEIIKLQLHSNKAQTKGFVLDLDFAKPSGMTWGERLISAGLLGDLKLTHVVEIILDDEEIQLRSKNLKQNIETGQVYSKWERDELRKPKPKKIDDDGNPIDDDDEDEENKVKLPSENELVVRVCDEIGNILSEIDYYTGPEGERKSCGYFIDEMFNQTYVKLDAAGLTPTELCDAVSFRIKPKVSEPLRPIAKAIEGGGDFKSLLTDEGNEEEGILPRTSQWSLWRTTDPVALSKGQVEQGVPDWAVHYANNVFVFQNEENMKKFIDNPRKYVSKPPQMPDNFRIMIMGPRGIGVHTQAKKLEEFYGWRTVDFLQIVQRKLAEIIKMKEKPPNNIAEGRCMVCMSQEELDKIKEGHAVPAWKFLPWILEYLHVPLKRKPIVPKAAEPEPVEEEMTPEQLKAHQAAQKKKLQEEAKKAKELAEAEAAKKERDRKRDEARAAGIPLADIGLEETEEEIIIEDLPIDQLTIDTDPQEDGSIARIERIILIGFPQTEIHVEKLKEYGFGFDRILFLTDTNEEEPGKEIILRNTKPDGLKYDWETEFETATKKLTFAQEIMTTEEKPGEEKVIKIDSNGNENQVFIKIRTSLDPFFLKPDNPEDVRVTADLEEDEDGNKKNLPRSDFGDYCPVTFVDEGFMVKGDPEKESLVCGKTYLFSGEKEQEKFNKDPVKYMVALTGKAQLPLQPPPPKIMLLGNKGSGVTTQIRMLCEKFKLDDFELQKEYLQKIKLEKEKRQRLRLLARGYKAMPIDEETSQMEPDPEIIDDPAEFTDEIELHEKRFMSEIIQSSKGLIIDGHWTTLPEETVTTSLQELLSGSKRMPEIVIILKCKEENTFVRTIFKDKIKAEFDEIMDKRKLEIEKKRAEARKAEETSKYEELKAGADEETTADAIDKQLKQHMQGWDEEEKEKEPNEYLEEEAPVYEEMLEKIQETTREQIEKDNAFIEEFVEALKEKRVEVVENLNTDISAEYVHIKLVDKLKGHLKFRNDLIEREQVTALKPAEVKLYEQSYTYRHSKFGFNSPISPFNPIKTKQFAVLYRERIYLLSNAEERQNFMLEPSKFVKGIESVPNDILVKPRVIVVGLPKSGKSDLCRILNQKIGVVHLQFEDIIEDYITRESSFCNKISELMKSKGREIDDLFQIQLLSKRIERRDCRENGWVLEDFPKTRMQAKLMAQRGLLPTNVINLNIPVSEVFKRTEEIKDSDFGSNRQILKMRLNQYGESRPKLLYFYQKFYNNVINIDGLKSRWFIQDLAVETIQNNIKARLCFARDFYYGKSDQRPCLMENLFIARELMKQSLSQFSYFCPVSFKTEKAFKHGSHLPELAVLYKQMFYFFAGTKERETFLKNPSFFTEKVVFSSDKKKPMLLKPWKASELISNEKELLGYCPVSLKDEERIEVGNNIILVKYDNKNFVFSNVEKARKFFTTPQKYFKTQLPVKMPPRKEPVGLYNLSKKEDSITFLEQALGIVVTKGLREVGETRLKYPTLSIKESSLKLFSMFLKCENPANTAYMKEQYHKKCQEFLEIGMISEELYELAEEKEKKQAKGRWPQFKEDYYNELGRKYDEIMLRTEKDKADGFRVYNTSLSDS